MKRETLFLKLAVFLSGIPILALCIFLFPKVIESASSNSKVEYLQSYLVMYLFITVIPFFIALYQAFKILNYIDKNKSFSELSVKALKNIKYCAFTISIMYVISMPLFFVIAQIDDAPGFAGLGLIITFASIVIGVFAAVLQKLLKNAVDMKSENDLMV